MVLLAAAAAPLPAEAQTAGALAGAGPAVPSHPCAGIAAGTWLVEVQGVQARGTWRFQVNTHRACAGVATMPPDPDVHYRVGFAVHAGPWNPALGGCLASGLPALHSGYLCLGPVPPGSGSAVARYCAAPWSDCIWTAFLKTVRA